MMTVCISEQSALLSMKELQSVTPDVGERKWVVMYGGILFWINNIKTTFFCVHVFVCNSINAALYVFMKVQLRFLVQHFNS